MRKMISKQAKIRNLVKRAIQGNETYVEMKNKIKAYDGETRRINRWDDSASDEVIRSKLEHYLLLTQSILADIRALPVVMEVTTIVENRQWVEHCTNHLIAYPPKGKDLKVKFSQLVFAFEKLINSEISARNI